MTAIVKADGDRYAVQASWPRKYEVADTVTGDFIADFENADDAERYAQGMNRPQHLARRINP